MNQRFYGSICVTDLLTAIKNGHSSISKAEKNGKMYASVNVWVNDGPDKYGNSASLVLNSTQAGAAKDGEKLYLGNFKKSEGAPINKRDIDDVDAILNESGGNKNVDSDISGPVDDLPF